MSQLNHGALQQQQQQAQPRAANETAEDLQHVNDDAATARHMTSIRIRGIRGQLADAEGEGQQD